MHQALIDSLTAAYAELPQVDAVAVAGSRGSDGVGADAISDIDLFVYTRGPIDVATRRGVMEAHEGVSRVDPQMNLEWLHVPSGIGVDVIVFDAAWMEDTVLRVVERHQAAMGYTTCFWHTIRQSTPGFDRTGWFASLQRRCAVPYPDALRQNIVDHNHPMLRNAMPSYANQIAKAIRRADQVSVNHRIAALVASYFDCLFAANGVTHPGEKRLVSWAERRCRFVPEQMGKDLDAVYAAAGTDVAALMPLITRLLDRLDPALIHSGLVLPV